MKSALTSAGRWALLVLAGSTLGGCASYGPVAPAVTPAMAGVASGGATVATLEAGRRTYATSCTACHRAYPVAQYSAAEWRDYVADMSHRAKLDAERQSALLSYLLAARTSVLAAQSR